MKCIAMFRYNFVYGAQNCFRSGSSETAHGTEISGCTKRITKIRVNSFTCLNATAEQARHAIRRGNVGRIFFGRRLAKTRYTSAIMALV